MKILFAFIRNFLMLSALVFMFSSCSSSKKLTRQYAQKHALKGGASYYGKKYQGKKTASGEKFRTGKLTAAHKTLPFGTIVKVTNVENKKSVKVKINDRGPFVAGRVIDLTPKAFKKIGNINKGVLKVEIKILDDSKQFTYKK